FTRTLDRIRELQPGATTLLDVGAATGDLVRMARARGFDAHGVELSEYAVAMAEKLNSVRLERRALRELQGSALYDCIHLNHVFEHLSDPRSELAHLARLLRSGGLLYIEVPYQFHAVEKLLFRARRKAGEFTLHSLHHPYFYTPKTIVRLLRAGGFETARVS